LKEGIKHEFSAPYTPQQNGVVERKNRTLIDMARTILGEYKTPKRFWSKAVNTACHAINRLYLHRLLKKTSYELLTDNKPNVSYFRVSRSKCYILVKKGRHSKFYPKTIEGFLLGYDSDTKAYRLFSKSSRLVEVSSDIVFDETNDSLLELDNSLSVGVWDPTVHPG
jgi:transposase InsO family protein